MDTPNNDRPPQEVLLDEIEAKIADRPARPGWAKVALFGHTLKHGFCEEIEFLGARCIAIYVPQADGTWVHDGTHGAAAIFEFKLETKRQALSQLPWVKKQIWDELERRRPLLPAAARSSSVFDEDDDDEDRDDVSEFDTVMNCTVCGVKPTKACDIDKHLDYEQRLESELAQLKAVMPETPEAEALRRRFAEGMCLPPDYPLSDLLIQASYNQWLHFQLEEELTVFQRELDVRGTQLEASGRVGGAHEIRGLLANLKARLERARETARAHVGMKKELPPPGQAVQTCRVCSCTEDDCRQCIAKTGEPCYWVESDLCSACLPVRNADKLDPQPNPPTS